MSARLQPLRPLHPPNHRRAFLPPYSHTPQQAQQDGYKGDPTSEPGEHSGIESRGDRKGCTGTVDSGGYAVAMVPELRPCSFKGPTLFLSREGSS